MCRKNKEIGKRIKELRVYLGLTQKEFAEKIYSSYRSVQNWESGDRFISESNLRLLVDAYGVSVDWIYHGTGEMFKDLERNTESEVFLSMFDVFSSVCNVKKSTIYAHIAVCDAMYPIISIGDVVLWIDDVHYEEEKLLFLIDQQNKPLIRKYKIKGNEEWLVSANPKFKPVKLTNSNFKVIGTIVDVYTRKKMSAPFV